MCSYSKWLLDAGICLLLLMFVTVLHCRHICLHTCLSACGHITCFLREYVCEYVSFSLLSPNGI